MDIPSWLARRQPGATAFAESRPWTRFEEAKYISARAGQLANGDAPRVVQTTHAHPAKIAADELAAGAARGFCTVRTMPDGVTTVRLDVAGHRPAASRYNPW